MEIHNFHSEPQGGKYENKGVQHKNKQMKKGLCKHSSKAMLTTLPGPIIIIKVDQNIAIVTMHSVSC